MAQMARDDLLMPEKSAAWADVLLRVFEQRV
jgi:hypothetical protein